MHRLMLASIVLLVSGCSGLLPRGTADVVSPFHSFESARDAIERIEPYRTREADLPALGFDPHGMGNVRLIPYPELIGRLTPNPGVPLEAVDPGIRDCILARQACRAYEFTMERQERVRQGPFLLDFLNFRRTTVVTGWRFEGLIVVSNGVVLFRNHGGAPAIERVDRQVNPLGPLQPAGEASGALLTR